MTSRLRLCSLQLLFCLLLASSAQASPASPDWDQLNAHQQTVLWQLSTEWNRYAPVNKHNLLQIVQYYDQLNPQQQFRLQEKLKLWAQLSQEQRAQARANWQALQALPPAQRSRAMTRLKLQPEALSAP